MAVPKQKSSKARGRKRRTHYKTGAPTITLCSECQEPKLPHRACPECGAYKGRNVNRDMDADD
ncbi:MAG TPA: 50S ribosomal protein L32 [Desulfobacter sp.]|uniref:50S ribosomal protein L32 n=1 Tax=Desulfobacter sp. UBA2225 TaxID=1961413 RepID=UPI000E84A130|nr:50S ribosomal protein L32 [Desulfobacter sp. UBA2225]HAR34282.1 50S ribosomal protein L32 [Desulfobacter sp.]